MSVQAAVPREYWPTTEWQTASPESHGMSAAALGELQAFGDDPDSELNGIAVVRHGYIVDERYFRGFHARSYQTLNSITKSVISTLVGIALGRGLLGLGQPLTDWFPEVAELGVDPRAGRITLRHLLGMTSGWSHERYELEGFGTSTSIVSDTLRRPLVAEPGTTFWYDNQAAHLTSVLVSRAVSTSTAAFAERTLLGPLGIWTDRTPRFVWRTDADGPHRFHRFACWDEQSGLPWKVDACGNSTGYAGLHFTLREMAKLGYLWLNDGRWDGAQLLPPEYVAESTTPQSRGGKPGDAAYGRFWWVADGDPNGTYFGFGAGGQYVFVSPPLDLVVAVASSGTGPGGRHGDCSTRDIFDRYVIPAVLE